MADYRYPVDVEGNYTRDADDEQGRILMRALWHYAVMCGTSIRDLTVDDIISDHLGTGDEDPAYGMTRDEWVEIGRATGVPV